MEWGEEGTVKGDKVDKGKESVVLKEAAAVLGSEGRGAAAGGDTLNTK